MRSLLFDVRPSLPPCVQSIALGLTAVLAIGLAGPVQAQSASAAPDGPTAAESKQGRWKPHFDEQIARALRDSSSGRMRTTLLQTLLDVAVKEGASMDFSAAVPALLRVIEHDPAPRRRLLALQALEVVGPERTDEARYRRVMARLRARVPDDASPAVRRAVASMLNDVSAEAPAS
ncbi:MAG: hypothetical protein ABEL97_13515 [Salinibacter sp.]